MPHQDNFHGCDDPARHLSRRLAEVEFWILSSLISFMRCVQKILIVQHSKSSRLYMIPTSFGPATRQIELLLPQHSIGRGVGAKAQMGGEGISSDQRQGHCKT